MSKKKNNHNTSPKSIWILYGLLVLIAFITGGIKYEYNFIGYEITIDFTKTAWLLPLSLLGGIVINTIITKGGMFEGFGIKAHINQIEEQAHNADEKAKNVATDMENALNEIKNKIDRIEKQNNIKVNNIESSHTDDKSIMKKINDIAQRYSKLNPTSMVNERIELDNEVDSIKSTDPEIIFSLTEKESEYNIIAAILLKKLALDEKYNKSAFEKLVNLATSGKNSYIRFRACKSLQDSNWFQISNQNLTDAISNLKKRALSEPNGPTSIELEIAAHMLNTVIEVRGDA